MTEQLPFYRFGFVSNKEIRGHAIRGWNLISHKDDGALQRYCNSEKSFADCFETKIGKDASRYPDFFEIHGNYYQKSIEDKKKSLWTYSHTTNCGDNENGPDNEQAQGIICK